jgi:hypothetical protein
MQDDFCHFLPVCPFFTRLIEAIRQIFCAFLASSSVANPNICSAVGTVFEFFIGQDAIAQLGPLMAITNPPV